MKKIFCCAIFQFVCLTAAQAVTITDGFTFAVASDSDPAVGTHFHSSTGGDFGNPAGKAEVGSFLSEEVRGLSEYDLTTLSNSATAFFTFDVFTAAGLFSGTNDFPFDGLINIFSYVGNNLEDISDYQAATTGFIGSFNPVGSLPGDVFSFDIASIYNNAIDNGDVSLGIRLQIAPGTTTDGGAWTFDQFRLTTDDQTTNPAPVPEPSTLALLSTGLVGLVCWNRRRRA